MGRVSAFSTAKQRSAAGVFSRNDAARFVRTTASACNEAAEQRLYNGGKRQFGWDVVDGRLVPNATEQAAVARAKALGKER
jgi:hypothetical protein